MDFRKSGLNAMHRHIQEKDAHASVNTIKKLQKGVTEGLESLNLQLSCQESTSYNGSIIWKISNYAQRKRDAKQGRVQSLFSQPFYTSPTGYKICARIYLNGDGIRKGTHVSLFFVIMQGEYDALLKWPFVKRVSFEVLRSGERVNHMDTFQSDVESTSFQRLVSTMNVASGAPLFITQLTLEGTSGYIIEDTVYIRITVE